MKKVYLILGGIILILSVTICIQQNVITKKDAKIVRLTDNVGNLMDENANLIVLNVTESELKGEYLKERDSLANLLKVRPKQVIRYITTTIIQHDTITEYIPVVQKTDTSWAFTDNGECYVYKGEVNLSDNILSVKRTEYFSTNKLSYAFYWYRKFPIVGKKRYTQEVFSSCGDSYTNDVTIVKRNK